MNYLEKLIEEIKIIDTGKITESPTSDTITTTIEEQKIYFWIRIYLKNEEDVIEGDEYKMEYVPSGESLMIKFITYQIINFDPEIDKKILCLMIDENEINTRSDIPFIRTLFKTSKFYDYQLIRRSDLVFTNTRTNSSPEYIDCDF